MSRAFIYYRIGAPAAPRYVRIASDSANAEWAQMRKDDVLHAMLVFNARTGNIDDNYSLVNTGLLRMMGASKAAEVEGAWQEATRPTFRARSSAPDYEARLRKAG